MVKNGTESKEEPELVTMTEMMTDIFWYVGKLDAKNREVVEKPEKKLPKHMRGLSDRMKGVNVG